jgi:hypothetical protein
MNLFRSEVHAKRWSGYREDASAGLRPLKDILAIFSGRLFRERLSGHYVSDLKSLAREQAELVKTLTNDDPFWRRKA